MGTLSKIVCFTAPWLALTLVSDVSFAVSDCLYAGVNFSDGAVSCQSGNQFQCSDGTWKPLDLACEGPLPTPTVINPAECICYEEELQNCERSDQACCVSLEGGKCTKRCCEKK